MKLDALMVDLDAVSLDMLELQRLSNTKLTDEQAADPALDLLTGFHLVSWCGRSRRCGADGCRHAHVVGKCA